MNGVAVVIGSRKVDVDFESPRRLVEGEEHQQLMDAIPTHERSSYTVQSGSKLSV